MAPSTPPGDPGDPATVEGTEPPAENDNGSRPTRPPSLLWLVLEGRAVPEAASGLLAMRSLVKNAPRGDEHPVLVLPGFLASDLSTTPLRGFLRRLGYRTHGWKLGRNRGYSPDMEKNLDALLTGLWDRYEQRVSLVGWSLGGVYARYLANRYPDRVRSVISLGSPFTGSLKANHSWRIYEWMTGQKVEEIDNERIALVRSTPTMPTTSIFSLSDGIAHWHSSLEEDGPQCENIVVPGSHLGLGVNPAVLWAVADRLSQRWGQWRRFEPTGLGRVFYRSAPRRGSR